MRPIATSTETDDCTPVSTALCLLLTICLNLPNSSWYSTILCAPDTHVNHIWLATRPVAHLERTKYSLTCLQRRHRCCRESPSSDGMPAPDNRSPNAHRESSKQSLTWRRTAPPGSSTRHRSASGRHQAGNKIVFVYYHTLQFIFISIEIRFFYFSSIALLCVTVFLFFFSWKPFHCLHVRTLSGSKERLSALHAWDVLMKICILKNVSRSRFRFASILKSSMSKFASYTCVMTP